MNSQDETTETVEEIDFDEMWKLLDSFPEQTEEDAEREFWFGYKGPFHVQDGEYGK